MPGRNTLAVSIVARPDLTPGLTRAQAQVSDFTANVNRQMAAAGQETQSQTAVQAWVASRRAIIEAEQQANAVLKAGRKANAADVQATLDALDARHDAFLASSRAYYDSLTEQQQASYAAQEAAANKEIEAEYQRISARLDAAAAVGVDTAALEENTAATIVNSGVTREASYMLDEVLAGRWNRLAASTAVMSNRLGIMQQLFTPLGLSIGAAAAAVGGLTFAFVEGERESGAFQRAVLETGGAVGVTEGQFNAMAQAIAGGDTTIGTARAALLSFAQSGRFTGQTLQAAAQGAVAFADVTGESLKEAQTAIESLATKPAEAITKLNDQYHFLSVAQLEHIEALQREGDAAGAAQAAVDAFSSAMQQRAQQASQDEGIIVKGWEHVKDAISDAWDQLKGFGRDNTTAQQIADIQARLANLDAQRGSLMGYLESGERRQLEVQLQALQAQERTAEAAAQQKAQQDQVNQAGIAAEQYIEKQADALKNVDQVQQHRLELEKQIEALHRANPSDQLLKGDVFNSSGALTQGNALYDQLVSNIQNKYGHITIPVSLSVENSEQEISQASDWLKQYASQREQIEEANSSASQQIMRLELDSRKNTLDAEVAAGRVSATQALTIEKQLTSELYAEDVQRLQDRLSTLDQESVEYARVSDQIKVIKAQEVAELAALDRQYAQQSVRAVSQQASAWRGVVSEIESAEGGMVSDILTKRRSLSQDLLQIGSDLVSKEIANDLRAMTTRIMLANTQGAAQKALEQGGYLYHVGVELAKTMTTQTGESARTAAVMTGNAARTTAVVAANASQKAVAATTGAQTVMADAAKAYSGVYASVAQIPYVGWILAPAAASAAFAAVAAYQSLASLDVGTMYVPRNMPAMLHEGEAVLPRPFAEDYRASLRGSGSGGLGGGGGGTNITHNGDIHVADTDVLQALEGPAGRDRLIGLIGEAFNRGARP